MGSRIAFEPPVAGAILACAMGSFLLAGSLVPRQFSIIVGQAVLVAVPVTSAIVWRRFHAAPSWLPVLGLLPSRAVYAFAAVLIGASAWYLNLRLVHLLGVAPSPRLAEAVERSPLLETLVVLAVLPPICEEILFRGVLARALANGLPALVAIVISAAAFAFYHLSLVQAAPTFTLGLVLAWLTLRSDSIVPAMIVHALNNAIAILISRDELPGVSEWLDRNPAAALAICATVTVGGLALLATGKPAA